MALDAQVAADKPSIAGILQRQRTAFVHDGFPDARTRRDRIARLESLVLDNADELVDALTEDYGSRDRTFSLMVDLLASAAGSALQRKKLATWMKPRKPLGVVGRWQLYAEVRPTPKGVVGIMGPWNFPLYLVIPPAAAALAAGNRVMMRPSEVTARTTEVFARLAAGYFPVEELAVITNDLGDGAQFSQLPLDHLFFTGSPQVGSIVAEAAGRNLVPVTLELGGKNPVVVDVEADLALAAQRVADSRMANGGQVCLCPDYVFVHAERLDEFTNLVLGRWKTNNPTIIDNPQYTSIINDKHYQRVVDLIADARARGATIREATPANESLPDPQTRKIAPTVVTGITPDMKLSREEVFGPVLAVHPYQRLREAIDYINERDHPLAIYWYGDRNERFEELADATRSGSISGNDFAVTQQSEELPFGGVGRSGTGQYRGQYGFDTFSHLRSVGFAKLPISGAEMMSAPFGSGQRRFVETQMRLRRLGKRWADRRRSR